MLVKCHCGPMITGMSLNRTICARLIMTGIYHPFSRPEEDRGSLPAVPWSWLRAINKGEIMSSLRVAVAGGLCRVRADEMDEKRASTLALHPHHQYSSAPAVPLFVSFLRPSLSCHIIFDDNTSDNVGEYTA